MSSSSEDTTFVLDRALDRARTLQRELERLLAKDFGFGLAPRILDLLQKTAKDAERKLGLLKKDGVFLDSRTPADERLDSIRTNAANLHLVHTLLDLVSRVGSSRLPLEMVRAFEQLAGDLLKVQDRVAILLQPVNTYNYRLLELNKIFRGWDHEFLVQVPSADSFSFLLHTILFHELGHPVFGRVVEKDLRGPLGTALARAERSLRVEIDKEVQSRMLAAGIPKPGRNSDQRDFWSKRQEAMREELLSYASEVARSWTEEIWCDLLATRLVGPGYLCAFQTLLLPFSSPGEASDSHPDSWLRLQVIARYSVQEKSAVDGFEAIYEEFGQRATTVEGVTKPTDAQLSIHHRIAHEVLKPDPESEFVELLFSKVRTSVPNPLEMPEFLEALIHGRDQLVHLVPPDPFLHFPPGTKLRSYEVVPFVFYVAWLFKLSQIGVWRDRYGWDAERQDDVLDQICMKALESAELVRRYRLKGISRESSEREGNQNRA